MIKTNKILNPLIIIRIEKEAKDKLWEQARKQGMQLSTYARMILLNSLDRK